MAQVFRFAYPSLRFAPNSRRRVSHTPHPQLSIRVPGISLYRANWAEPNTFKSLLINSIYDLYGLRVCPRGAYQHQTAGLSLSQEPSTQIFENEKTK